MVIFSSENTALFCSKCQVLCHLCLSTRVDIASHVLLFELTLQKATEAVHMNTIMWLCQLVKKFTLQHLVHILHCQEQS